MIFDCDGVLVNSETLALHSELEILRAANFNMSESEYLSLFAGLSRTGYDAKLREEYLKRVGSRLPLGFEKRLEAARWARYERELKPFVKRRRILTPDRRPILTPWRQ